MKAGTCTLAGRLSLEDLFRLKSGEKVEVLPECSPSAGQFEIILDPAYFHFASASRVDFSLKLRDEIQPGAVQVTFFVTGGNAYSLEHEDFFYAQPTLGGEARASFKLVVDLCNLELQEGDLKEGSNNFRFVDTSYKEPPEEEVA